MQPLEFELSDGNVQKDEDHDDDQEGKSGIGCLAQELLEGGEDLHGIGDDCAAAALGERGKEVRSVLGIADGVVFIGVGERLRERDVRKDVAFGVDLFDEDGIDARAHDGEVESDVVPDGHDFHAACVVVLGGIGEGRDTHAHALALFAVGKDVETGGVVVGGLFPDEVIAVGFGRLQGREALRDVLDELSADGVRDELCGPVSAQIAHEAAHVPCAEFP